MNLSISKISDMVMAQSAIAAIINEEKYTQLLTSDHDLALKSIIRQEFCRLSLLLSPYLGDIDLGADSSDTMELTFSDPVVESNTTIAIQIEWLLGISVIAAILTAAGTDEAENYRSLSAEAGQKLQCAIEGFCMPGSLRACPF